MLVNMCDILRKLSGHIFLKWCGRADYDWNSARP